MKIKIGLVDDHQLFLKSLSLLLNNIPNLSVIVEASHGKELQEKMIHGSTLPDIILLDVEMPVMNGIETAKWLHQTHPTIRLVALSMNEDEQTVIEMIKAGCCSYLLKDTHPHVLEKALMEIYTNSYYNADIHTVNLSELLLNHQFTRPIVVNEKEREFLQYATSDRTYKEIARIMDVSNRTIDGYRESLFEKFNVQSRTGMILEAIRRGIVKV
jgi:DNA-binding NarL/FixJ family response regulator